MFDITTSDGETVRCSKEQADAVRMLQRAIKSVVGGYTMSFLLTEVDGRGHTRGTNVSIDGAHLPELIEKVREQADEFQILATLWEGNAPLIARSIRKQ